MDTPTGQTVVAQLATQRANRQQKKAAKPASQTSPGTSQSQQPTGSSTYGNGSIPTITIHEKDKWLKISSGLRAAKINFGKAESLFDGIHLYQQTTSDHRNMSRWLAQQKVEHHVYNLPQDKPLRIVIRSLPHGLPCEGVKNELLRLGFPVTEVSKLKSGGPQRRESHFVYVLLKKSLEPRRFMTWQNFYAWNSRLNQRGGHATKQGSVLTANCSATPPAAVTLHPDASSVQVFVLKLDKDTTDFTERPETIHKVDDYLNSLPAVESHYRRAHNMHKKYLPSNLTMLNIEITMKKMRKMQSHILISIKYLMRILIFHSLILKRIYA